MTQRIRFVLLLSRNTDHFTFTVGVAADQRGIAVADWGSGRIQVYCTTGKFIQLNGQSILNRFKRIQQINKSHNLSIWNEMPVIERKKKSHGLIKREICFDVMIKLILV